MIELGKTCPYVALDFIGRLRRDVVNGPARLIPSVQGALRTSKNFDSL